MGSALKVNSEPIYPLKPSATHVDKEGYLVNISGETATISSSATTPARGVILEGALTTAKSSVGILGGLKGSVLMKTSGAITKGDLVQQAADGTIVTDAAAGARVIVGTAMESAVSGDLIEVVPCQPTVMA